MGFDLVLTNRDPLGPLLQHTGYFRSSISMPDYLFLKLPGMTALSYSLSVCVRTYTPLSLAAVKCTLFFTLIEIILIEDFRSTVCTGCDLIRSGVYMHRRN